MLWRHEHGCDYVAVQQFKIARFIMPILETINFQIRFCEDTSQKKGREQAHDRVQGGNAQNLFGAMQYMGLIII